MLFLFVCHIEAKESDQTMMLQINNYNHFTQVLAGTKGTQFLGWFGNLNCCTSLYEINIHRKVTCYCCIAHYFLKYFETACKKENVTYDIVYLYRSSCRRCSEICVLQVVVLIIGRWNLQSKSLKNACK